MDARLSSEVSKKYSRVRDPLFEKINQRLLFAAGKKSGDTLTKEGAPAGGSAVRPFNYLRIGTGGSSLSQSLPF